MQISLIALCLSAASAFQVGIAPIMKAPLRAAAPQAMLVPDMPVAAMLHTTNVIADTTLLFSGGLLGFIFLFAVVGEITFSPYVGIHSPRRSRRCAQVPSSSTLAFASDLHTSAMSWQAFLLPLYSLAGTE